MLTERKANVAMLQRMFEPAQQTQRHLRSKTKRNGPHRAMKGQRNARDEETGQKREQNWRQQTSRMIIMQLNVHKIDDSLEANQ